MLILPHKFALKRVKDKNQDKKVSNAHKDKEQQQQNLHRTHRVQR